MISLLCFWSPRVSGVLRVCLPPAWLAFLMPRCATPQIYWLHMVYAALGAICFTLVSLLPVLGQGAERVGMEFRQLGKWLRRWRRGGGEDNCSLSYLEALEVSGIPAVFCSHSLLCDNGVSAFSDRGVNCSRAETMHHTTP